MAKSSSSKPLQHSHSPITCVSGSGRTLFVGDVHGCALELSLLLEMTSPTRVVLIGDVFTKGPDPLGVWKLIKKWNMEAVFGNHEAKLLQEYRGRKKHYLPKKSIHWIRELPLWIEEENFFAVHAGLNPYAPRKTKRSTALVVRRWPDDRNLENPFWWELYRGEKLVIYGHDAARQLQDHRPYTLGLDSGCVYGGALTGYLLEEDCIYQVPARDVYVPIKDKGARKSR